MMWMGNPCSRLRKASANGFTQNTCEEDLDRALPMVILYPYQWVPPALQELLFSGCHLAEALALAHPPKLGSEEPCHWSRCALAKTDSATSLGLR